MALNDLGTTAQLFVSNVFNISGGFAGSVTRLNVSLSPSGINVLTQNPEIRPLLS